MASAGRAGQGASFVRLPLAVLAEQHRRAREGGLNGRKRARGNAGLQPAQQHPRLAHQCARTVRVAGTLGEETVASLRALGLRVEASPASTAIQVSAHDPSELYRVIDLVRPARLAGIDDALAGLEQVYLDAIRGAGARR